MIEIGKKQSLTLLRKSDHGVYLGEEGDAENAVLLPRKQVPEDAKIGDVMEVFIYRDSSDRRIATLNTPKIELGQLARLTVSEVTKIGAFLDWGLEKDLFLPFKEQLYRVQQGDQVLVGMYTDKSGRLCATMRIQHFLTADSPYKKEDIVTGYVYEINPSYGAFIAVDGKYFGMIPRQEWYQEGKPGDTIEARVLRVREDGKLDLSGRKKAYKQMDDDAKFLWDMIEENGGVLALHDKSDPELIREKTSLSKNAFKRAVGHLLREGKIELGENCIRRKENGNV